MIKIPKIWLILLFTGLTACHSEEPDTLVRALPQTLVLMAGQTGGAGNLDGVGTDARFNSPGGMVEDGDGNLYVADTGNDAIRKLAPDGTVTTLVGAGATGALAEVPLNRPRDLALDEANQRLYVADTGSHVIRVIDLAQQSDDVLTGEEGTADYLDTADGAPLFDSPSGIAFRNDVLYIADSGNHAIRKISDISYDSNDLIWNSTVETLAGSGTAGSADGVGNAASFDAPEDLALDGADNIIVADTGNHVIRYIDIANQSVTTIAGLAGEAGYVDDADSNARFDSPASIAIDGSDQIYVADRSNHLVRQMQYDFGAEVWDVLTLAGVAGQPGSADGDMFADCTDLASCALLAADAHTYAQFDNPRAIAVRADGNLLIADSGNHSLRLTDLLVGFTVSTLAGQARVKGSADAQGASASFNAPTGLALDSNGNVYVADSLNDVIRKIDPSGVVSTIAGSAGISGNTDGQSTEARFNSPSAIAIDRFGNLYVADSGNHRVRKITSDGSVSTYGKNADDSNASFDSPGGIAVDSSGNVYVAATGSHAIYKIAADESVTLLAGSDAGLSGDSDGIGTEARFNTPLGLAVSGSTVYVADSENHCIRSISASRQARIFAGKAGVAGDDDSSDALSNARFNAPSAIAVNSQGALYIADSGNHSIREISGGSNVSTVIGASGQSGIRTGALPASLYQPMGVALAPSGNLLLSSGNAILMANLNPE